MNRCFITGGGLHYHIILQHSKVLTNHIIISLRIRFNFLHLIFVYGEIMSFEQACIIFLGFAQL